MSPALTILIEICRLFPRQRHIVSKNQSYQSNLTHLELVATLDSWRVPVGGLQEVFAPLKRLFLFPTNPNLW
jgi:hypothetical protein